MVFIKTCLAVCASAIFLTQGESRQLCGEEVEYRGFNPIEALQLIQARQFQEFEQFKNTLSQLKFKLQSEDYSAWKRCLSEYEKEKLRYLESVEKIKSSFNGLVQSLATRKLAAAQYDLELQKIFQQFQTQFTPAANLFKTNIKYLLDTIRDDDRRKKWWSTVKTTEEVTTSDGKTTRTSTTQVDSGIGNKRSQSITKKSQSVSSSGGYDAQSSGSSYDASSQRSASGYGSSSQQAVSGYAASQKTSGYETQQRSGYGAVSKTKEVKQESATVTGSTVDNSGINFSNTQTRSGLREGYSTNSYKASNGGYRRRRTLGLLGVGVGVGVGAGTGLAGAGVGAGTGLAGAGVSAGTGLAGAGVGAGVNIGLGAGNLLGGKSGYGQQQQQQQQSMNSRSSLGYGNGMGGGNAGNGFGGGNGGNGFGGGNGGSGFGGGNGGNGNGMGGGPGGYDNSGAGGYQARASQFQESSKSEFQQAQGAGFAKTQKSSEFASSSVGGAGAYY
ncbi:hypothetical protein WDU94_001782 [Cyamophila willieti]